MAELHPSWAFGLAMNAGTAGLFAFIIPSSTSPSGTRGRQDFWSAQRPLAQLRAAEGSRRQRGAPVAATSGDSAEAKCNRRDAAQVLTFRGASAPSQRTAARRLQRVVRPPVTEALV